MALLDELYPASFKGVPFLCPGGDRSGGRKTVIHEFPNSDKRFVEDLGLNNPTFTIAAVIKGENYTQKKKDLIFILDQAGLGQLVHPFYGSINCVALSYSLSELTTELGQANFSITFAKSDLNTSPNAITDSISQIYSQTTNAINSVEQQVENVYAVSNNYQQNFSDAQSQLDDLGDLFETSTTQFNSNPTTLPTFTSSLVQYQDSTIALVSDPSGMSSSITNLFSQMNDLSDDGQSTVDLMNNFFNFGDDNTTIVDNTPQRHQRIVNRAMISGLVQYNSLAYAYQNATLINYLTINDINTIFELLEAQYQKVLDNQYLNDDVITNLTDLRILTLNYLNSQQISVYKITDITTNSIPITVLTYQYYGDNSVTVWEPLVKDLVDLNNLENVSFVSGTVSILTS